MVLDHGPGTTVVLEADVVVVGSGAGGGVVSRSPDCRRGYPSWCLEAGPFFAEAELPTRRGRRFS